MSARVTDAYTSRMNDYPLADGFVATPERFLWHPATGTAVLADMHLGAEAELTRQGILMPDVSRAALEGAWRRLCRELEGAREGAHLIVAGDLFDVPAPDAQCIALARELFQALPARCRITLIPGNHDPTAESLAELFRGLPLTIAPATSVGGYTVFHGHQGQDAIGVGNGEWLGVGERRQWVPRGLIVGHQHPAVVLQNRVQGVKMICYAACQVRLSPAVGGDHVGCPVPIILLPSFSRMSLGSNLTEYHWIVDLPRPEDEDVRVFGIVEGRENRVLDFGSLAGLRLPF